MTPPALTPAQIGQALSGISFSLTPLAQPSPIVPFVEAEGDSFKIGHGTVDANGDAIGNFLCTVMDCDSIKSVQTWWGNAQINRAHNLSALDKDDYDEDQVIITISANDIGSLFFIGAAPTGEFSSGKPLSTLRLALTFEAADRSFVAKQIVEAERRDKKWLNKYTAMEAALSMSHIERLGTSGEKNGTLWSLIREGIEKWGSDQISLQALFPQLFPRHSLQFQVNHRFCNPNTISSFIVSADLKGETFVTAAVFQYENDAVYPYSELMDYPYVSLHQHISSENNIELTPFMVEPWRAAAATFNMFPLREN